ncbi:nitrilase-related carbon-nitrogen hydrolase [Haloactinomyces albus]|uniref:Amidohydrolase n=1 Tax=Haloactinomyces albus TaxID=1352928 RepID=A0AAE4CNS7_9ACTN|nr:nitrilase-related carbon-nitrogen hydrolase [Haloactinomyces albus]MDR7303761.1 putative amidohydrolase [Haloactinomyces albus]
MRVAMVQAASPPEEPVWQRRHRIGRMVRQARGADLVVLPELWAPGYFAFDAYDELAESLNGDTVSAGRDWARDLDAHVHLGSILERGAEGRIHNTAVLIAPDGSVLHTYRKMHVFGYQSREAELLTSGDTVSVADSALGPIGSTTCYDLRFPELWRALVDAGAQTVAVPAAWPAARRAHWQLFTTTRAVEQQMVVIGCNAVGEQHGTALGGHSRIVDPWGEVLVEAGTEEGITCCEVDIGAVGRVRAQFPVLRDRRLLTMQPHQNSTVAEVTMQGGQS